MIREPRELVKNKADYSHVLTTEQDGEYIGGELEIRVDSDGYFVRIISDPYEGYVMIPLPLARQLLSALESAIKFAEEARPTKVNA